MPVCLEERLDPHPGDSAPDEAQGARGPAREVDDPAAHVGAAVVDRDDHALEIREVCDAHAGSEFESSVGGGQHLAAEDLSARGLPAVEEGVVIGGAANLSALAGRSRRPLLWGG